VVIARIRLEVYEQATVFQDDRARCSRGRGTPLFHSDLSAERAAGDVSAGAVAAVSKNDRKEWGASTSRAWRIFVLPSFTPDLKALDEQGIRNDVRHAIRQGFGATTSTALA